MADGTIKIDTSLDSSGLEKGLKSLSSLAGKGAKVAVAAVGGISTAIGGIAVAAGKVGMDFEAQMSRVQAISGATAEELECLKDQAVDLGAETAFSARETAEGMENLASAGFSVSEIMEAMPGMLDLAASSGEDLAASADIAASTLRGFGLEASEAGHVADVLAKNAADTNAAVADTGEAMKYIAPLARAAGLSLEETAAAIGIMADNGIKGSQAGTTLRGALSRLSKPTQDMQEAMDELGISFYDSEGKMLSLSEQISMLKRATEGLTDEQRNNYLVTLYGQESLSGMLALINTTDGKLEEMTQSYMNCDGAAEEMATTMQDNLKSAIEQVGGAAESFGITVYESIQDPLKDAAFAAADAIDQITDAFKTNGAAGAAEAAGGIVANLVTGIAEAAPSVIDTAVTVVQSFVQGLIDNKDRLWEAAGEIVGALADGLVKLLPKEIGEPLKKVFDDLGKSLQKGGLKKGIDAAIKMFQRLIKAVGQIIDTVGPALVKILDFIGEHLDVIGPIAVGVVTALLTFKKVTSVINSVTTSVKAFSKAISFSPAGIVAGIASIVAGLAMWAATSESAYEKAAKFTEEEQALVDSINEHAKAVQESADSIKSSYDNISLEYENSEGLLEELQGIADANGRIKDGYEERAKVITEELSSAFGVEIQMTDGVIENYQEVIDNLDQIIEKKKASAMADAMSSEVIEARKNEITLLQDYRKALQEAQDQEQEVAEAKEAVAEAQEKFNEALAHPELYTPEALNLYEDQLLEAQETLAGAEEKQRNLNAALDDANYAYSQNQAILENYDALQEAIATGSTADLEQAIQRAANTFITAESGNLQSLQRQYENFSQTYDDMKAAQESGLTSITDEQLSSMQQMVADSEIELQKLATSYDDLSQGAINGFLENIKSGAIEAGEASSQITPAMVAAIANSDMKSELSGTAREGLQGLLDAFAGMDEQTRTAMAEAITPMLEELEKADPELYAAAAGTSGSVLNSIIDTFGVGAPTIYTATKTSVTDQVDQAVRDGRVQNDATAMASAQGTINATATTFTNGAPAVATAATTMANAAGTGIYSSDTLYNALAWAAQVVGVPQDQFIAHMGDLQAAAAQFAQAGATGFTSADLAGIFGSNAQAAANAANEYLAQGAGTAETNASAYGTAVSRGISNSNMSGAVQVAMDGAMTAMNGSLTTGSNNAVKTVQTMINLLRREFQNSNLKTIAKTEGINASQGMTQGIRSGQNGAVGAARELANGAIQAIESANMYNRAYQVGLNFANGMIAGIQSRANQIAQQAAATVTNAINAANAAQQAHSPAKKTIKVGQNWGGGIVVGIEDMQPKVDKAAGQTMIGAMDAAARKATLAQMRAAMDGVMQRAAVSMSLNRQQVPIPEQTPAEPGEVNQTVNIYQPVKSPVEMSREMKKTAKEMAWH